MNKEFSSIVELKSIREQKSRLSERENELSRPFLSDYSLIQTIYVWFKEILANRDCPPNPESVNQRKKFLFVILFLYSPSVLAGGKMPDGLRDALCRTLGMNTGSTISKNCADVVFLYQNYADMRRDVDGIYDGIMQRLHEHGII